MISDIAPFKLAGNLYFIGTRKASSHLLVTSEGLVLIDTGYDYNIENIKEGIEMLGFDIMDVKHILHSHGHGDHTDATAELVKLTGAKTYLAKEDVKYIKGFTPDVYYTDGGVIKIGETEILCLFTPGHTEGTYSLFFNIEEDGKTYRVGTFGGASANQLKKDYYRRRYTHCRSYLLRGQFYESIERLKQEHVDIFVGNHAGQNHTQEKAALIGKTDKNPFIDPTEWPLFLESCRESMDKVILNESRTHFVTYAHRGASEYAPENTMLAFHLGLYMGANGIETDVQKTKDGVLVLFHDDTLERVTGEAGSIADYTYEELLAFRVKKGDLEDRIVTLDAFLQAFGWRDLTLAIEIKQPGIEKEVADMILKYDLGAKVMITSFKLDCLKAVRAYAPILRTGYLKGDFTDEEVQQLRALGIEELCPKAVNVTAEKVAKWHQIGFNVRAWGVADEALMQQVYDALTDGCTVNFPDKLIAYIDTQKTDA